MFYYFYLKNFKFRCPDYCMQIPVQCEGSENFDKAWINTGQINEEPCPSGFMWFEKFFKKIVMEWMNEWMNILKLIHHQFQQISSYCNLRRDERRGRGEIMKSLIRCEENNIYDCKNTPTITFSTTITSTTTIISTTIIYSYIYTLTK